MHGTVVCAVTDGAENDEAVEQAAALSERLGLRLVLAHVVDGGDPVGTNGGHTAGERRLEELARDHDLLDVERRLAVGDRAMLLGQIASEEAADVIVVGARACGWARRGLESPLAQELETETPVPVLIAPPRTRRAATGKRR